MDWCATAILILGIAVLVVCGGFAAYIMRALILISESKKGKGDPK